MYAAEAGDLVSLRRIHQDCLNYFKSRAIDIKSIERPQQFVCIGSENRIDCLQYTTGYAARTGQLDCIKYAHENGCDINTFTVASAAWYCSRNCSKNPEKIELFEFCFLNWNKYNDTGSTIVQYSNSQSTLSFVDTSTSGSIDAFWASEFNQVIPYLDLTKQMYRFLYSLDLSKNTCLKEAVNKAKEKIEIQKNKAQSLLQHKVSNDIINYTLLPFF